MITDLQWWCSARGEEWTWRWRAYPGVWIAIGGVGWWLRAQHRRAVPSKGDRALGIGAIVLLWLTLDWPIGPVGAGYLASVHTLQFVSLAMLVPPMLLVSARNALRDYGMELGLAFQLVDDVLDYRGESGAMGKNTGDDLREGKMTLPVILALADANPAERDIITASLGKPDATDAALAQVVAIMNRHDALTRTVEQAHEHVRKAREALAPLPPSGMRTILSDIAEFYVSRAY